MHEEWKQVFYWLHAAKLITSIVQCQNLRNMFEQMEEKELEVNSYMTYYWFYKQRDVTKKVPIVFCPSQKFKSKSGCPGILLKISNPPKNTKPQPFYIHTQYEKCSRTIFRRNSQRNLRHLSLIYADYFLTGHQFLKYSGYKLDDDTAANFLLQPTTSCNY